MRRFSQRSSLVTLSEINITPLLDLAFVLLIIFVITTPLLEQGLNLKCLRAATLISNLLRKRHQDGGDQSAGEYMLDRRRMPLDQVERELVMDHHANPEHGGLHSRG